MLEQFFLVAQGAEDAVAGGFLILGMFCYCFAFLLVIGGIAFWVWMLVDCITKEPANGEDRTMWILLIALLGAFGALLYYFIRRPQRIAETGQ